MQPTVLITGASTGIGRATTAHLASRGYRVLAGVRNERDAAGVRGLVPERVTPLLLDVTDAGQIAEAGELVDRESPDGLLALINNAGHNYNGAFEYAEEKTAGNLMAVNFFGLCNLTRRMIPALRRHAAAHPRRSAKLVNISSIGGLVGIPWEAYYHASKFAVVGLTESLRHELWAQRIRAVVVCPGVIDTDFLTKTESSLAGSLAKLPADAGAGYRRGLSGMLANIPRAARFGSRPEKVSQRISSILEQAEPEFRHLVGVDAKLVYGLSRWLPAGMFHAVLRRQLAGDSR